MLTVRRVGVLGAGTMGSRIAAHFANAGVPVLLLDLPDRSGADPSANARKGLEAAARQNPGAFFTPEAKVLVTPGNFEDDWRKLGGCDWIVEAVAENLDIKRSLWAKVAEVAHPNAILSTNTSGIPLHRISAGLSGDFQARFLGTHFFNPPRYLHLVEAIPGPGTAPDLLAAVGEYCDIRLGKGVVLCKDTPNFIANRIGSFFGGTVAKLMVEGGFTVEEVDALTGPLIGLPKSASLRLLDIVGLDVWGFVSGNLYEAVPEDPWRERFLPPAFLREMIGKGWLGEKSGQGFYRRVGPAKEIHAIDWRTLEYHPAAKPRFVSVEAAQMMDQLPQRLRALTAAGDRAGQFLWSLFRDHMLYAAGRVPEISDRIVEIDRSMRWGYAHTFGPFELWDALGFTETARRMQAEGCVLPAGVEQMLRSGATAFYRADDDRGFPGTQYFDLLSGSYRKLETRSGVLELPALKRARGVVRSNPGASLVDLGDGALCLEFHSKMNTLGEDAIRMLQQALAECEQNFQALVVANQGNDFSVGANLLMVLMAAQEGEWEELDQAVRRFQAAGMAMKYSPRPVVSAPFGRTLGGGAEWAMHASRVQASAELYMGLVEAGVGLIPAGGGCKEMLLRLEDPRRAFEVIGYAKVSASAEDARKLGFLRRPDGITMNPERLIEDAKELALSLAPRHSPGAPREDIPVSGLAGMAQLKLGVWAMREGAFISDHDRLIGDKLAHVLSGGPLTGTQKVSEQYLLDLEREAFLSLCGTAKTQERMQYMLKTGKALRN